MVSWNSNLRMTRAGFGDQDFCTTAWPEVPFQGMRALMLSYADLRAALLDRWGLWKSRTS